jgi:hypothetical protein
MDALSVCDKHYTKSTNKVQNTMQKNLSHYHTYILRFWQEQDAAHDGEKWRFTLMDSTQGHRHGFSSLDDLMAFLKAQMFEE